MGFLGGGFADVVPAVSWPVLAAPARILFSPGNQRPQPGAIELDGRSMKQQAAKRAWRGPDDERRRAKALGEVRYWNGRPCIHGHVDYRMTSTGGCVACKQIAARKAKRRRSLS